MNFFKAIKKFYNHLTKEQEPVTYEKIPETQESEDTVTQEETILETSIENPYVNQLRDWAIQKIELLHEADRHRNARALEAEFSEWIHIPEGTQELEYLSIEDEEWTEEQEIDVNE
jgi:hypothetical protein